MKLSPFCKSYLTHDDRPDIGVKYYADVQTYRKILIVAKFADCAVQRTKDVLKTNSFPPIQIPFVQFKSAPVL